MIAITNILAPTDFSEGANLALARALELSHRFAATMTVLHVYQLPIEYTGFVLAADMRHAVEEAARLQMAETLQALAERARNFGGAHFAPTIASRIRSGATSATIVDEAQRGAYDLLVIATHGRTGADRWFIGSVAERVVRTASCPVLSVR